MTRHIFAKRTLIPFLILVLVAICAVVAYIPRVLTVPPTPEEPSTATVPAITVTVPISTETPTSRQIYPQPSVLKKVIPGPGVSLPLEEYVVGLHGDGTWFGESGSKICAEFGPIRLDDPNNVGALIYNHVCLWVDNVAREIAGEYRVVATLEERLNEQGTPISKSTGPAYVCWSADLEPGTHIARWSFETITGRTYEYEWYFEITD